MGRCDKLMKKAQESPGNLRNGEIVDTYSIRIVWSDEDEGYIATSPEFEDLSAFGTSAEEAITELEAVIRIAIDTYTDSGWALPEPLRIRHHSGQLRVRLPKSLHARLADEAERDGVSLNTLIVTYLSLRMGEAGASLRIRNELRSIVTVLGEAVELIQLASATALAGDRIEASG